MQNEPRLLRSSGYRDPYGDSLERGWGRRPCRVEFGRKALCNGATFWSRCPCAGASRGLSCIVCGLTVWLVLVPLFLLTAVAGILAYAMLWSVPWWLWMACRGQMPQNWTISRANADKLEEECARTLFPPGTRSEWISLLPRRGASGMFASARWQAHRLVIPCRGPDPDPPELIVIHGSGSAATLMMSSCAQELSEKFVLHCVDLPGYGRTPLPDGVSMRDVERLSGPGIIGMQCDFIERYCITCDMHKPFVVAHSAGAFYTMMWASTHRDPSTLGGVVLVSLAGCMPTFNICAAHISVAFILGVPQTFFRILGRAGSFIFQPAVHGKVLGKYWLNVQASRSHINVSHKFTRTSLFSAIWLYPGLLHLLRACTQTSRIALVVGGSDVLASDSEMAFVSQLASRLHIFLPCFSVCVCVHSSLLPLPLPRSFPPCLPPSPSCPLLPSHSLDLFISMVACPLSLHHSAGMQQVLHARSQQRKQ